MSKTKISLEDDGDEYGRISFDFETTPDKILKAVQDKVKILERNSRDSPSESIDKIGENSGNDKTLSRRSSRSSSFILHADDISKSDLHVYRSVFRTAATHSPRYVSLRRRQKKYVWGISLGCRFSG